jgi:ABC-type xylose transport system permease subunit
MTEKKRKILYWVFKLASILISCALPVWAICEKFPIWTEKHGTTHSIGIGFVLIIIVVLIVFRRTVFDYIRDHFDLKHAPPLMVWLVLLVVSYIFVYLGEVMRDMTTVLWMGLIGCAIGTVLTYISNKFKA